ncbi:MAG: YcxB family protein [Firmicutes bacterium]|nr:YcxB family protein [Bacillota bacterium]
MFEFQFEPTMEDYCAFSKHHLYHSPAKKKYRIRMRFIWPLVFGSMATVFIFLAMSSHAAVDSVDRILFAGYAAVCAVAGISFLFFHKQINFWVIQRSIKKNEKYGKLYTAEPRTYQFRENLFFYKSKNETAEVTYANLERIDMGEEAVYVYMGVNQALVLPNRIFADEEEKRRFAAFIQGKINEAKEAPAR